MMTDAGESSMTHSAGRSRSLNTPASGVSASFMSDFSSRAGTSDQSSISLHNCCQNEIELRDRVMSSKRILLRNFFSYYIKSLMMVNEQLNASYLNKLKLEYAQLREGDKIPVSEVHETIE